MTSCRRSIPPKTIRWYEKGDQGTITVQSLTLGDLTAKRRNNANHHLTTAAQTPLNNHLF